MDIVLDQWRPNLFVFASNQHGSNPNELEVIFAACLFLEIAINKVYCQEQTLNLELKLEVHLNNPVDKNASHTLCDVRLYLHVLVLWLVETFCSKIVCHDILAKLSDMLWVCCSFEIARQNGFIKVIINPHHKVAIDRLNLYFKVMKFILGFTLSLFFEFSLFLVRHFLQGTSSLRGCLALGTKLNCLSSLLSDLRWHVAAISALDLGKCLALRSVRLVIETLARLVLHICQKDGILLICHNMLETVRDQSSLRSWRSVSLRSILTIGLLRYNKRRWSTSLSNISLAVSISNRSRLELCVSNDLIRLSHIRLCHRSWLLMFINKIVDTGHHLIF